jgi:hypothetical protein
MAENMSTRGRIATAGAAAGTVALALAVAGCAVIHKGDVSPSSVESTARTLTRQTLDAVRPVVGPAGTSVERSAWQQCSTETPGQHRFTYTYTLDVSAGPDKATAVMAAASAYFAKQGYELDPPDARNQRAGARVPKSTWAVGLGVKDSVTTVIQATSGCVFTTHAPPTAH